MELQDTARQANDSITVGRVFGEPIERDGVLVIPVAAVQGGGGGGSGTGTGPDGAGRRHRHRRWLGRARPGRSACSWCATATSVGPRDRLRPLRDHRPRPWSSLRCSRAVRSCRSRARADVREHGCTPMQARMSDYPDRRRRLALHGAARLLGRAPRAGVRRRAGRSATPTAAAPTIDGDRRFPTVQLAQPRAVGLSTLNDMWAREYGRYDERGWDPEAYVMACRRPGHRPDGAVPEPRAHAGRRVGSRPRARRGDRARRTTTGRRSSSPPHPTGCSPSASSTCATSTARSPRRGAAVEQHGFRAFFVLPGAAAARRHARARVLRPAVVGARGARRGAGAPQRRRHRAGPDRRRPVRAVGAAARRGRVPARVAAHAVLVPRRRHLRPSPRAAGGRARDRRRAGCRSGCGGSTSCTSVTRASTATRCRRRRASCSGGSASSRPRWRSRPSRAVVDALGADCIVTASDFPHPEGTFPNGVREFAARDDLTDRDEARHPLRQPQAPLPTLRCVFQPSIDG